MLSEKQLASQLASQQAKGTGMYILHRIEYPAKEVYGRIVPNK
jgi:hypothetical protein